MEKWKLEELKSLIEDLKVLERKQVESDHKFITSKTYDCTLASGEVIRREQLLKGGLDGSAALILPVTPQKEVVLTVEPRVFTKRTVGIGVPAGYIEKGEKAIDAARRELLEETGYTTSEIVDLGGFYQDMGVSAAYNRIFLGLDAVKTGEQHLDDGEFIQYFTCTLENALELIDMGYIEGCNAIITLQRAEKYLRKVR